MRDISGSLARQALLVAGVCLLVDVTGFLLTARPMTWQVWVVLAGTVLADAALAFPARLSGAVALGHAALAVLNAVLLCRCNGPAFSDNAGILIAGYRAGAWLGNTRALLSLGALCAGVTACELMSGGRTAHDWRLLAISVLTLGVLPWLVGRYTTARRAYIAQLEQREERLRHDEEEAVRRAVADERRSIARDLHDVISHHVSAIGVHAGAARLGLGDGDGGGDREGNTAVRRSLSEVESASRSAMLDLRRLLDVLHGPDGDGARRQPGLDNLDELVDGVRAAGLPVRLAWHGRDRPLPGSLDIALYRIAQEALTNALRHGDSAGVDIELDLGEDRAHLTVTNGLRPGGAAVPASPTSPTSQSPDRARRGLAGIRQRAGLFGGDVEQGPLPDGRRWRLRVTLPVEPA